MATHLALYSQTTGSLVLQWIRGILWKWACRMKEPVFSPARLLQFACSLRRRSGRFLVRSKWWSREWSCFHRLSSSATVAPSSNTCWTVASCCPHSLLDSFEQLVTTVLRLGISAIEPSAVRDMAQIYAPWTCGRRRSWLTPPLCSLSYCFEHFSFSLFFSSEYFLLLSLFKIYLFYGLSYLTLAYWPLLGCELKVWREARGTWRDWRHICLLASPPFFLLRSRFVQLAHKLLSSGFRDLDGKTSPCWYPNGQIAKFS